MWVDLAVLPMSEVHSDARNRKSVSCLGGKGAGYVRGAALFPNQQWPRKNGF